MEEDQSQTMPLVHGDKLPTGEIVAGKYRIESVVGSGGMGTVYRVTNIFFEKEFALKVLDTKCAPNAVLVKRFQNEAKAAFSLNHPNLVKVHDFGIFEGGAPYLVMDLVVGETLADLIKKKTVVSFDQYLPILEQICAALYYAHSNSVIHRDVKPANIMLSYTPTLSVKILDFGIAKIVNEEAGQLQELTRTGEIFGSPLYMSPEQCSGGVIDHRTDIYSLGCVSYEALTGAPPHVGVNALRTMMLHQTTAVVPLSEASLGLQFSPECEHVVATMLAKEPSERYSDARAIVAELNPSAHDQFFVPQKRSAPLAKEKPKSAISLNPGQLLGLVVGVMAATAIGTYFVVNSLLPKQVIYKQADGVPAPAAQADAARDKESVSALPDPFLSVGKIESIIKKNASGLSERVIQFPPFKIGQVCVVNKNYDRGTNNMQVAQGLVVVPADALLRLDIVQTTNEATIMHPQIMKSIEPTLFAGLAISNNDSMFSIEAAEAAGKKIDSFDAGKELPVLSAAEATLEKKTLAKLTAADANEKRLHEGEEALLNNVQSWTNLRAVSFDFATVTDGMVDALSRLKRLECIRLIKCEKVSAKLDSLSLLPSMRVLEFEGYEPEFLWSKPQRFQRLEDLSVDSPLSPAAIAAIKTFPKLKMLRLRQQRYALPPALVDWIAQSKLEVLKIDEATISPEQVKKILSNRNIGALQVSERLESAIRSAGIADALRLTYVKSSIID